MMLSSNCLMGKFCTSRGASYTRILRYSGSRLTNTSCLPSVDQGAGPERTRASVEPRQLARFAAVDRQLTQ